MSRLFVLFWEELKLRWELQFRMRPENAPHGSLNFTKYLQDVPSCVALSFIDFDIYKFCLAAKVLCHFCHNWTGCEVFLRKCALQFGEEDLGKSLSI